MGQPDTINYFSEPEIIRVIPSWLHKVKGFTAQKKFQNPETGPRRKIKNIGTIWNDGSPSIPDKAIAGLLIFVQTREPP